MYKEILKKYETMEKGSRQRKMKFNPKTDVGIDERETVENWVDGAKKELREKISSASKKQPMNQNAKNRNSRHNVRKD